jgi:plasmid replication initiation protein
MDIIQTSLFVDEEMYQLAEERNQLVVKHNSLIQKTRYSLSTQQQKIILYLISRIKPDDDELIEYDYDLKDFCRVCGIETHGQNYRNAKESILQLHNKAFWIETEDVDTMVSWVQKAIIYKKDTRLRIRLDETLKPFLLHLREQFTQYELSNILCMRSKHSIRLYEYLKSFLSVGKIILSVAELKELLDCNGKGYVRWNNFKQMVLDKALQEINEYSDLEISIDYIKAGKTIEKVIFIIQKKDSETACITRIKNAARLNGTIEDFEKDTE